MLQYGAAPFITQTFSLRERYDLVDRAFVGRRCTQPAGLVAALVASARADGAASGSAASGAGHAAQSAAVAALVRGSAAGQLCPVLPGAPGRASRQLELLADCAGAMVQSVARALCGY